MPERPFEPYLFAYKVIGKENIPVNLIVTDDVLFCRFNSKNKETIVITEWGDSYITPLTLKQVEEFYSQFHLLNVDRGIVCNLKKAKFVNAEDRIIYFETEPNSNSISCTFSIPGSEIVNQYFPVIKEKLKTKKRALFGF